MNPICKDCLYSMKEKGGACFKDGFFGFRAANVADTCLYKKVKETNNNNPE